MHLFKNAIVTLLIISLHSSCQEHEYTQPKQHTENISDFKGAMRDFVINMSTHAKQLNPSFYIIPQNGIELVTTNGKQTGSPHNAYLDAIDAHGQESLFYGYPTDDTATPDSSTAYTSAFLNTSKSKGNKVFVINYCSTLPKVEDSYSKSSNAGYISFAANKRNLTTVFLPTGIYNENNASVHTLDDVQNFLALLNKEQFTKKNDLIKELSSANYDLIIIDAFFNDGTWFTKEDVKRLKQKPNGEKRLVISYMSIGEAEEYRYYWKKLWTTYKPDWLAEENTFWKGNYKVRYWDEDWQNIIYGNNDAYLDTIIDLGFDGVYLDIIDAFQYFEEKTGQYN